MVLRRILLSKPVIAALGIIVVVAAVVVFLLPTVLRKPLSTQVVATLQDGSQKVIYDDAASPLALIQIGGVTVNGLNYKTTFTGTSPNYATYKVVGLPSGSPNCSGNQPPNGVSCESFYAFVMLAPGQSITCQVNLLAYSVKVSFVPATFTNTLNSGQSYSLGSLAYGNADGTELRLASTDMLNWINAAGCSIPGTYTLIFRIQMMIQAIGTGALPTARYGEWVNTTASAILGSLNISGSTTATPYVVDPFFARLEAP